MAELSSFDIIGPSMIGPSSSHTAGACRIGNVAYKIAEKSIKSVKFYLHGSFAKTYRGHGTDKALLAGVLGFEADDERIKSVLSLYEEKNIMYEFLEVDLGDVHSNTVKIVITKEDDNVVEVIGSSIGGGNILITRINGLDLEFSGEYYTLIVPHTDKSGIITKVTYILSKYDINIAFMKVYRRSKGKEAFMILELDGRICKDIIKKIEDIEEVNNVYSIDIGL